MQRSFLGQVMTSRPCPTCRGAGETIPDPCHKCGGDGRVRARRDITVKVPAGVAGGMRIRLAAQGEVGPGGGHRRRPVRRDRRAAARRLRSRRRRPALHDPGSDGRRGTGHHRDRSTPSSTGPRKSPSSQVPSPGTLLFFAGTVCRSCGPECAATCTPTSRSSCRPGWITSRPSCSRNSRVLRDRDEAEVVSAQSQNSGGLFSRLREAFSGR